MIQPVPGTLDTTQVLLFVAPNFSSHALTMISNVLRLANRELGQPVFSWRLVSQAGAAVGASDGIVVQTERIDDLAAPSAARVIFILASYQPRSAVDRRFRRWLGREQRHNAYLVGVESGTYLLADAGLLGDHAVALHFEDHGAFRETWPNQPIFEGLFNFDDRVATVAGVTATLDFALALVERWHGPMIADQIARILLSSRRDALGRRLQADRQSGTQELLLRRCRELMLKNLQTPLSMAALCTELEINQRRLRRLFAKALNVSPHQYYLALRLTEARFMLVGSEISVSEVGLACGFDNPSAFARAFKAHFGFPPSQRRTPYMGLMPTPFWPQTGAVA